MKILNKRKQKQTILTYVKVLNKILANKIQQCVCTVFKRIIPYNEGFTNGSVVKNQSANARDTGVIPESR